MAVFLVLFVSTSRAAETRIHAIVAIEMKVTAPTRLDLRSRPALPPTAARSSKLVQDKVRAAYPQAKNRLNADNFMKDKHLGRGGTLPRN